MWIYDPYLWGLNDKITHSETRRVWRLLTEKELMKFQNEIGSILDYSFILSKLPIRPEVTLNMLDFDDTIHDRSRQLNQLSLLQDNRWLEWNRVLKEEIWYRNVLEHFYIDNEVVRRIFAIIEKQSAVHKAFILTAGEKDWQIAKCYSVGIREEIVPIITVETWAEKPKWLLDYIISQWYIPGKIIVYEDRPEYFLDSGVILSKILGGVELVVDKVKLSQWNTLRQIERIEQTIYLPESKLLHRDNPRLF